MIIELAQREDIGALVELRLAYIEADHGPLEADVKAELAGRLPFYFQAHLGRDLFCCVARVDGIIAACAFLLTVEKPPSPAFMNGRTGTVLNVYTRPEYRRRGLARRVMEHLIEETRQRDICVMNLKATDMGQPLYRSVGFVDDIDKYHPMKWSGAPISAGNEKRTDIHIN